MTVLLICRHMLKTSSVADNNRQRGTRRHINGRCLTPTGASELQVWSSFTFCRRLRSYTTSHRMTLVLMVKTAPLLRLVNLPSSLLSSSSCSSFLGFLPNQLLKKPPVACFCPPATFFAPTFWPDRITWGRRSDEVNGYDA